MNGGRGLAGLKVDVDTHVGMRDGVPRLLSSFARHEVRATFFVSFGPDNAGKAVWNVVRRRGFLQKMVRTRAPALYGVRTILSGTLLPSRPIGTAFPDLLRRIVAEGHEVASHAWDHRLWQDHVDRLSAERIRDELRRAFDAFADALGAPPRAVAAPAWFATPTSLRVQDDLDLDYASDMRGGPPVFVDYDGYASRTLQIPTTQPCLEELLAGGERDVARLAEAVVGSAPATDDPRVIPLHAEVEGGRFRSVLDRMLDALRCDGVTCRPLGELADRARMRARRVAVGLAEIPGRAGPVLVPTTTAP